MICNTTVDQNNQSLGSPKWRDPNYLRSTWITYLNGFATQMNGPQLFAGHLGKLFATDIEHTWHYLITSKMKHHHNFLMNNEIK